MSLLFTIFYFYFLRMIHLHSYTSHCTCHCTLPMSLLGSFFLGSREFCQCVLPSGRTLNLLFGLRSRLTMPGCCDVNVRSHHCPERVPVLPNYQLPTWVVHLATSSGLTAEAMGLPIHLQPDTLRGTHSVISSYKRRASTP
jgi:hypothetical protein